MRLKYIFLVSVSWIITVIFPVAAIWGYGIYLHLSGLPIRHPIKLEMLPAYIMQTAFAGLPFIVFSLIVTLKLRRSKGDHPDFTRFLWAGIFLLSGGVLFWGYYIYEMLTWNGMGGANIGLGVLMLYSPACILGLAFMGYMIAPKKQMP